MGISSCIYSKRSISVGATADYWVNAMDGKPFFVVGQAVDPGMLQGLENEIVPRLEADVPNQPSVVGVRAFAPFQEIF